MTAIEVGRDDLRRVRTVAEDLPSADGGEAVLRVDRYALTANNITYAVYGDAMGYWRFFPSADEGWGRVPVWGFADVVSSRVDGLAEGTRVYGYLPMAGHVVVLPERVDPSGFVDGAPHRAGLAATYNRYSRVEADPYYAPDRESVQMLLWPLFATSFFIDDHLAEQAMFGADTVILSSASSKTAIGTARLASMRDGVEVVGLTSARHLGFVERLGCYDRVVSYDALASLGASRAVFVDLAGDGAVRAAVHRSYSDRLAASIIVGGTHWEAAPPVPEALPGPAPAFFFAPDHIARRTRDWGREGMEQRLGSSWRAYADWADSWLEVHEHHGVDAALAAYRAVLDGRSDPAAGHVVVMG